MSESVRLDTLARPEKALEQSTALWFVVTFAGQLLFAAYILVNYGASAAIGDYAKWNRHLIHPLTTGDIAGDIAIIGHIVLALVITVGGPAQIILAWLVRSGAALGISSALRGQLLRVHRWNGRIYVAVAVLISAGAVYMVSTQRPILFHAGPFASALSVVAQDAHGLLIIVAAVLAVSAARAHKLNAHRYWALLTFLLASGVWFQRIGYGFWTVVTGHSPFGGGALGTTADLDGWFDLLLVFARFALPWVVLELYMRARNAGDTRAKWAMTGGMTLAAAVTAIGTVGAAKLMWLPSMMSPP